MTRKSKRPRVNVGDRVALTGNHPWVGHSGEVIERQEMTAVVIVRLDDGYEVQAWPRQYFVIKQGDTQ